MRIVAFVGSPVETEEKELVKLAKRLKKEKVNVDIVSFGEEVSPQVRTMQVGILRIYLVTHAAVHGRLR
jgi:26S proteasome regulatory subunit N10